MAADSNFPLSNKAVVSWALYDWANSAFATTIMAGFFPIFFKQYWSVGADLSLSTFRLGLANSFASVLVALSAPLLGAIADHSARKKHFLGYFAALGVIMTGGLFLVDEGGWELAILLYVGASLGFLGGNIFYNALIYSVAQPSQLERVSALGYAFGYLGGGLLFAANVAAALKPGWFGFADASQAIRGAFLSVAVWWTLFAIPLFRHVREPPAPYARAGPLALWQGLRALRQTFTDMRHRREIWIFLLAYWLYIDAVDTIVVMAVDYGLSLGFQAEDLILALLITQFVGFPATLVFGCLGSRFGPKAGIYVAILVYLGATVWGALLQSQTEFYLLAAVIGLVQGGIQSLSRALYARLIPPEKAAELFGFYGLLSKFASIFGPILVGSVTYLTGNHRLGLLSIALLFVAGAFLLAKVDVKGEGQSI